LTEDIIVEYVLDRFENFKKDPTKNKLVTFHTNNKFLLMCHNQEKLRILGNIVANHQKKSFLEIIDEYEKHLKDALSNLPTTKRHINTLMHVLNHFSKEVSPQQKESFLNFLEQFRRGKITIGVTLLKIEPLIHEYNNTYLLGQTYFSLYTEKRPWKF
jgi:uncharacterized protein YbgA (DUF1722 family)